MDARRRTPRISIAALALGLCLTLGIEAPAGAHGGHYHRGTSPLTSTPDHLPVWAADFMAGAVTVSEARAIRQARHFDVIVALKGTYAPYVTAMKAANPDLTLLVYLNGVMAQSNQGSAYPPGWYATDAQGDRVRSVGFGNYLMRPDNPGWVDDVTSRCRSFLNESGYDGCFLDVLGTAPLTPGYVTSLPVDPSTGEVWTRSAWMAATDRIARATRGGVAPAPVFGNGLADGARYFSSDPSSTILDSLDGAMAEQFVRDPTAPVERFRHRDEWWKDVLMLSDAARRGKATFAMTKVWTTASRRQITAVQRYALGTFLLGYQPGQGFFSFRSDHGLTRYRPVWSTDLGDPLGPARRHGRAFVRRFQHGIVVVNPTAARIHVRFGRRAGSRGRLAARVVVGAHSASILTA